MHPVQQIEATGNDDSMSTRKFAATLLLKFFVLYYKRNIKHFIRIDIQLYQRSWKLEKREIVWKHDAHRAECFHTISTHVDITVYQHGKCFIFLKSLSVAT